MAVKTRKSTRTKLINILRKRPVRGVTSDEAERELRLPHQTVSARLSELEAQGLARRVPKRRRTRAGGFAEPYRITSLGDIIA